MISKKICLLGSFAVGKTSMTKRFVEGQFTEKYLTTIGVKIDKKSITVGEQSVNLVIWDMEGRDEFAELRTSYLRGAAGYLLVTDCTRPDTLKAAIEIQRYVSDKLHDKPFLLLLSKTDLVEERRISHADLQPLLDKRWTILETSAKTGANVERAFHQLVRELLVANAENDCG